MGKDVASASVEDSLLNDFQEILRDIEAHVRNESLKQEGFCFQLSVCLGEAIDKEFTYLVLLFFDFQEIFSIEKNRHIEYVVLDNVNKVSFLELEQEVFTVDQM